MLLVTPVPGPISTVLPSISISVLPRRTARTRTSRARTATTVARWMAIAIGLYVSLIHSMWPSDSPAVMAVFSSTNVLYLALTTNTRPLALDGWALDPVCLPMVYVLFIFCAFLLAAALTFFTSFPISIAISTCASTLASSSSSISSSVLTIRSSTLAIRSSTIIIPAASSFCCLARVIILPAAWSMGAAALSFRVSCFSTLCPPLRSAMRAERRTGTSPPTWLARAARPPGEDLAGAWRMEEWNDGDPGGGSDGLAAADGKVVSSFIGAQCDEADRKDL